MPAIVAVAQAKPIAFADAWTFMAEGDRYAESVEAYYAPAVWWSIGPMVGEMRTADRSHTARHEMLQANLLLKRWNLDNAQGNLFASLGVGTTYTTLAARPGVAHPGHADDRPAFYAEQGFRHVLQGDYETRRIYTSFKIDVHRTPLFFDRVDTVQAGFSPYAHDYEDLAVWFIAQAKRYRGMNDKSSLGGFVRLFRKNWWVELGVSDRKPQAMFMYNY